MSNDAIPTGNYTPQTQTSPMLDPANGLLFFELSHEWGHHTPIYPGFADTLIYRSVNFAAHGVMSQRVKLTMHNSTHVNAPLHLIPGAAGVGQIPVERFFGNGPVLNIRKERWELITAADLAPFDADVGAGDIVIINTGWHRRYSDSQDYFGDAPGLSTDAAEWLVSKEIRLLGIDTPNVDHPLASALAKHRKGPLMPRLKEKYQRETGRDPDAQFPYFCPAHKTLLSAGIPTIENVGGALDEVTGVRSTFQAFPWKWFEGDACIVRLMAIQDPSSSYAVNEQHSKEPTP